MENKVLASFMKDDPKMNPLFSTYNLINNNSELIIFNRLLQDCLICVSKKKNLVNINSYLHNFCKHCINLWLLKKKNCPICKRENQKLF